MGTSISVVRCKKGGGGQQELSLFLGMVTGLEWGGREGVKPLGFCVYAFHLHPWKMTSISAKGSGSFCRVSNLEGSNVKEARAAPCWKILLGGVWEGRAFVFGRICLWN